MKSKTKNNTRQMTVGIGLGQRYIAAIAISQGKTRKIIDYDIIKSKLGYYEKQGFESLKQDLVAILKSVNDWIGKRYISIRVSIDDPEIYSHTMRFESVPRKYSKKKQLVMWQLERAFNLNKESLYASFCSSKGKRNDKTIIANAIDRNLLDTINEAFCSAGIIPESVMMSALYRKPLRSISKSSVAVQIYVHPEYVSVVFWNSCNIPISIRSFWRRISNDYEGVEMLETIRDIERTIHAFSISNRNEEIAELVIHINSESEQRIFVEQFNYIKLSQFTNIYLKYDAEKNQKLLLDYPLYLSAVNASLA
jgi:hypothetical protein